MLMIIPHISRALTRAILLGNPAIAMAAGVHPTRIDSIGVDRPQPRHRRLASLAPRLEGKAPRRSFL
jgi:hypothetical protein